MTVTREDVIAAIENAHVVEDPAVLRDSIRLSDQGVDSLGVFNVLLLLSERYDIEIPDADVDRLTSIAAMVEYLNGKLG